MDVDAIHDRFRFDRTVLIDGVPDWGRNDLTRLLHRILSQRDDIAKAVSQHLRLTLPAASGVPRSSRMITLTAGDDQLFIELLHHTLAFIPRESSVYEWDPLNDVQEIAETLARCQSRYRVAVSDGQLHLEDVVDETVRLQAEEAMAEPGSAAQHLAEAWTACYRYDADLDRAVDQAGKAMESALKPLISPNNGVATAGTIAQAMRDKPDRWTLPTAPSGGPKPVSPVLTLSRQVEHVWRMQRRHGSDDGPREYTSAEAEAAVATAVHVVHVVQRGLLVST